MQTTCPCPSITSTFARRSTARLKSHGLSGTTGQSTKGRMSSSKRARQRTREAPSRSNRQRRRSSREQGAFESYLLLRLADGQACIQRPRAHTDESPLIDFRAAPPPASSVRFTIVYVDVVVLCFTQMVSSLCCRSRARISSAPQKVPTSSRRSINQGSDGACHCLTRVSRW